MDEMLPLKTENASIRAEKSAKASHCRGRIAELKMVTSAGLSEDEMRSASST